MLLINNAKNILRLQERFKVEFKGFIFSKRFSKIIDFPLIFPSVDRAGQNILVLCK